MSRISENSEEIVAMYNSGMSVQAICNELNMWAPQVYIALDRAGIERRPRGGGPHRSESPEDVIKRSATWGIDERTLGQILKMFEEDGKSGKEIADTLKLTYTRVLSVLRDARVQVVPGSRRRWKTIRDAVMHELDGTDKPIDEIAMEYGIEPGSGVYKILLRMGRYRRGFVRVGKVSEVGEKEALVEEVLMRLREEYNLDLLGRQGVVGGGIGPEAGIQLQLPLGDEDKLIGRKL